MKHALGGEKELHPSLRSEVPLNDIADTSVRIQTSAEDRLLREESKMGEVFFVPSCYARDARATFVMWSIAEEKRCIRFVADT